MNTPTDPKGQDTMCDHANTVRIVDATCADRECKCGTVIHLADVGYGRKFDPRNAR